MKKAAIAIAALALAACGSEATKKDKTGNSGGSPTSIGKACNVGQTLCEGDKLLKCENSKYILGKDCGELGGVCQAAPGAAGVYDCAEAPAAPGTCTTGFSPSDGGGFAFFDNDIFEMYTVIHYGDAPGWDYVEVDAGPEASGSYELPDLTDPAAAEAAQVPVSVILARDLGTEDQKVFIATGGTVNLGAHGTVEGELYSQIDLTNITAYELVSTPDGQYGLGEETACLSSAKLKDMPIFRYPCFFMDMEVGATKCVERTSDNVIVNCEEGPLTTQSGNAGQLTLAQNCGTAACGGTPEAPVCQ